MKLVEYRQIEDITVLFVEWRIQNNRNEEIDLLVNRLELILYHDKEDNDRMIILAQST